MTTAPTFGRRGLPATAPAQPRFAGASPPPADAHSPQPSMSAPQARPPLSEGFPLGFGYFFNAVTKNYVNFSGRTGRKSFWFYMLCSMVVTIPVWIMAVTQRSLEPIEIFSVAILLPDLGIKIRRLHDVGKSGWWFLIAFVPFGAFYLLYLWVQPSERTAPDLAEVFA